MEHGSSHVVRSSAASAGKLRTCYYGEYKAAQKTIRNILKDLLHVLEFAIDSAILGFTFKLFRTRSVFAPDRLFIDSSSSEASDAICSPYSYFYSKILISSLHGSLR